MTLAATLTSRNIANTIRDSQPGCFMHGPTYMGNPLACAVANANIKILQKNKWQLQVFNIEKQLCKYLLPLIDQHRVLDVRILGAIGVVECICAINISKMQNFFVENGVWIRPFKKLIYIIPPYIISLCELNKLIYAIKKSLDYDDLFI